MPNKRRCRNKSCREFFKLTPEEALQEAGGRIKRFWCSDACKVEIALNHAQKAREGRERSHRKALKRVKKENAQRRRSFYEHDVKTRRKAAIHWFNKYIRLRDRGKPCISCGAGAGTFKLTAGHFITAGSCTALRFDPRNVHGQCWFNCNKNKSGNISGYRKGILDRFGEKEGKELLEFLEGPQPIIKITPQWYKSIEDEYKAKCNELQGL